MNLIYFVIALAGGVGLAFQAAINSRLAAGIGSQPLMGAFFSFAVGAIFLGLISLFQGNWNAVAAGIGQISWWKWLGGILGGTFVFISTFLAPKIGLTNMAFLFILGQLTAGLFIDGFGLAQMPIREIFWWKYLGLGVMLVGLTFFMFGDKISELFH
ncbi:DMT family transporter [Neisseria perflava]|uniref:DMT family transporter n=1 Tax=Neisseria perflava TaxID=33053 RepID=UPI00209CF038|nr:DMT family transporter [Neisseria perflava]MCP1661252.1 transporter family-2 protein [Neisseria perflava]MCP1772262.1 transporter family-2 protein [Neisseria perflava]